EAGHVVARRRSSSLVAFLAFLVAPAPLLRPQRRLALGLLSVEVGSLTTVLLFAPQGGFALRLLLFELGRLPAFLFFAPQGGCAFGRSQLLTPRDGHKALLKPAAARFVSTGWLGSLSQLLSCRCDRSWRRTVFNFAHNRGCRKRGSDQRISPHQHDHENG